MVTEEQLIARLNEEFPDAQIKAYDMTGGGDHWRLSITTAAFTDKSPVEQHQMVYAALGDWMQEAIHALSLETAAQ